jgi:hypothetical protein
VFRSLDENELALEYEGQPQRIRRDRVLGVVLARVAGAPLERGYEGILALEGGGRLPVLLDAILPGAGGGPRLRVEVHGAAWEVDIDRVLKIDFASDRIRFLSDLEPGKVEEVPLLGGRFPHRRDLSVGGGPIRLKGVEYRKGIGVHARCALEYVLEDGFATFAAMVGIDEAAAGRSRAGTDDLRCRAVVRVLGDGRTLFEGMVSDGGDPIEVVVPIPAVKVLRLEADYGEDGTDLGDHVDWAEARVVKPAKTAE